MSFGVEDPSIQFWPYPPSVFGGTLKQQIEILERFSQKERLHFVAVFHVFGVFHVVYGSITLGEFGKVLESVEYRPSPFLVLFFSGDGEHVKEGFDGLGTQ